MPDFQSDLNRFAHSHQPCILLGSHLRRDAAVGLRPMFAMGINVPLTFGLPQAAALLAGLRMVHDKLIEEFAKGLGITESELRSAAVEFSNTYPIREEDEQG
jgi:hypothetical protein